MPPRAAGVAHDAELVVSAGLVALRPTTHVHLGLGGGGEIFEF